MNDVDQTKGARIYLYSFCTTLGLSFALVLFLVLYIDPLWITVQSNQFNKFQRTYDERLTKTLKLAYGLSESQFDAVLIGSSRASYIPADKFKKHHVFNYAVSSLYPGEYLEMLDFFSRHQGYPKQIIIGADFFGTRSDWQNKMEPYLKDAANPYALIKKIFTFDSFYRAVSTLIMNATAEHPREKDEGYDRDMKKTYIRTPRHDPYASKAMLKKYCNVVYGSSYSWNYELPDIYKHVTHRYRNSQFLVYTSPTTGVLYDALVHSGRYGEYERWLTLLVETFGEVIDLMGHNQFTDNPENYYDYHHFSSEAGGWLVESALEIKVPVVGVRVNRLTLKNYLFKKRVEADRILRDTVNPCAGLN